MARVLGVVVLVSCSDTAHHMRQLCFLGNFLCLGGCYSLGCSKSLIIGLSQRTWLDTLPGTSWCHLHCLYLHRIDLIVVCCVALFQFSLWDGRFKTSVVHLRMLISSLYQAEYGYHCHDCGIITIWCMVNSRCTHLDLGEQPKTIVCRILRDIFLVSLQFAMERWRALSSN